MGDGLRTWYRTEGEGGATPAVICHGGPGGTHDYVEAIAGLDRPCVLSSRTAWIDHYNFTRPHGSLGHKPPGSRLTKAARNNS